MPKSRKSQHDTVPTPIPGEPAARSALAALQGTAQRLRDEKEARRNAEKLTVGNVEKYKKAINQLLSTPEGMDVFKRLLRYMRVFEEASENNVKMVEENGMRRLYLRMIRQFLKPTIRAELENL